MKKVLALVLAVAMMSTVAFAATVKGTFDMGAAYAGTEWTVGSSDVNGLTVNDDFNTKNYSIKKVSYENGKAYVDSVKLDDDEDEDELKVTFKKDFSVDKEKKVELTVTLRGKNKDVDHKDVEVTLKGTYGYTVGKLYINEDNEIVAGEVGIDEVIGIEDGEKGIKKIAKFVSGENNGAPYGTLEFSADNMADVEARVYDGDKMFLGYNMDSDKKVLVANADSDAEISFLNFPAKPSFNSTATVYFYEVDEDGFVYELTGEGKIKKSAAKWSEDDGCWVLKTRTLGSYVFSDKALTSAAAADATDGTTNPDTGANDVVGIATALAVVSLVAAGAVSLKK